MSAAELTEIRTRLGLSGDQLAAEFGIAPHVVTAWERGTVRVSANIAQHLRWRSAVAERDAVMAASGLAECATAEALDRGIAGKSGDAALAAMEQLIAHAEGCETCKARAAYAEQHAPPIPDLPLPRWMRVGAAIDASFDRLPTFIRPPDGDRGHGRRMGLWFGLIFSAIALVIVAVALIRRPARTAALGEAATALAVIIAAYLVGFYLAGAAYDALRPIGHRFAGYVLRWGIGGAIVYGAIALAMTLFDDDPMSWSQALGFTLLLGGVWGVIGAGIWVKDRVTGKLPKRAS
jgi:hypothetical protein